MHYSMYYICIYLGKPQKKSSLNGRAIKALPPPLLGLNGPILENIVTTWIKYLPTNFNVICPYFPHMSRLRPNCCLVITAL